MATVSWTRPPDGIWEAGQGVSKDEAAQGLIDLKNAIEGPVTEEIGAAAGNAASALVGKTEYVYATDIASITPEDSAQALIQLNAALGAVFWARGASAPSPVTDEWKQTADNTWWRRIDSTNDLRDEVAIAAQRAIPALGLIVPASENGYVRAADGVLVDVDHWRRTNMVAVSAGDLLSADVPVTTSNQVARNIAAYDASGAYLGATDWRVAGHAVDVRSQFPTAAYVRISAEATTPITLRKSRIWDAATAGTAAARHRMVTLDGFAQAVPGYLLADGGIGDSSSWRVTQLIPVFEGEVLTYSGAVAGSVPSLAAYNAAGAHIGTILAHGSTRITMAYRVPAGTAYIRACSQADESPALTYHRPQGVAEAEIIEALPEPLARIVRAGSDGSTFGALRVASVVAMGDSITEGAAASTTALQWPSRVAALVAGGVLDNNGVSGSVMQNSPIVDGAARLGNGRDNYVSRLVGMGEVALIGYGFNDARYTAAPTTFNVAEYRSDYDQVLSGLMAQGFARDQIVVVTPHYITDVGLTKGSAGFTGQTRAGFLEYVAAARALAAEYGCWLAESYDWMEQSGAGALISGDDIHPNDAGHAVIADAVANATLANTAEPVTLTATPGSGSIGATVAAYPLAMSYEMQAAPLATLAFGAVQTGLSASWSGLSTGSYVVRARAQMARGRWSPWTVQRVEVA